MVVIAVFVSYISSYDVFTVSTTDSISLHSASAKSDKRRIDSKMNVLKKYAGLNTPGVR